MDHFKQLSEDAALSLAGAIEQHRVAAEQLKELAEAVRREASEALWQMMGIPANVEVAVVQDIKTGKKALLAVGRLPAGTVFDLHQLVEAVKAKKPEQGFGYRLSVCLRYLKLDGTPSSVSLHCYLYNLRYVEPWEEKPVPGA